MTEVSIYILKGLRKGYGRAFNIKPLPKPICERNPDIASSLIYNKLKDNNPCMIARFGATELSAVINYLGIKNSNKNIWKYIKGEALEWWWNKSILTQMQEWSGFFPPTLKNIELFSEMMLKDAQQVDILGSWLENEQYIQTLSNTAKKVQLSLLDPYWAGIPWTRALTGKKVLVIHPFAETISSQYKKRLLLFKNSDILPEFDLKIIKAVQSLGGGNSTSFKTWFDALDFMKEKIEKTDFDICLIGAGAYGFPLAAHVKRLNKKAVHLGGSLQLLFGIRGKRWENENYSSTYNYSKLINEHWVRAPSSSKSSNADIVEDACYW
jgi:hypothetical protein